MSAPFLNLKQGASSPASDLSKMSANAEHPLFGSGMSLEALLELFGFFRAQTHRSISPSECLGVALCASWHPL